MPSWVKASQSVGSNKETEGNVNLVKVEQAESSNGLENPEPSSSGSTLNTWISNEKVLKAEILWSLYSAANHLTCRDSNNTSALFEVMFSDSKIAKQFISGKDKTKNITSFVLAPFFSVQLTEKNMKTVKIIF